MGNICFCKVIIPMRAVTPASWHKWFSATFLVNKDNEAESKILLNHLEWIELAVAKPAYLLS